jgi:EAL domain-containing protein (putative c-di-GMP-specific phosphodiesterase class I)
VKKTERTTVRTISGLAHNLGMRVVAEGVETQPQWEFLIALGCDVMQGYLFSPPRPAVDAGKLFALGALQPRPVAAPASAA